MKREIRIYPPGTRITDADKAATLSAAYPRSFRIAQDVLVATEKYHKKKGGLFSSEGSRIRKLQKSLYELRSALEEESFEPPGARETSGTPDIGGPMVTDFLSEFSDAFPNWQAEYDVLNRFIPQCF